MARNPSHYRTPTPSHVPDLRKGKWGRSFCHVHIIILLFLTPLMGCAPLRPLPPAKPITRDQAHRLISQMKEQADEVFSFIGIGRLLFREGEEETEMNLLTAGQRPSKVRLEVSHTWGKPLLYLVVDRKNVSVLSFVEHTFYSGPSSQLDTRQFFFFELDQDIAWVLLAGRIPILPHCKMKSLRPNELILLDGQGEAVEVLIFPPDLSLPSSIHFPGQGFTVLLSRFKEGTSGPYPSKITIAQGNERQLEIRYTSLQANRPIPEEIFRLDPPPDIQVIQPGPREQ